MRRNNRLDRLLPPNVDPDRTASAITGASSRACWRRDCGFSSDIPGHCQALYTYVGSPESGCLSKGRRLRPFRTTPSAPWSRWPAVCTGHACGRVSLYGSFSQGSRSLYLMHRLPEGRKLLTGYVVKAPLVCLAGAAVVVRPAAGDILSGLAASDARRICLPI